MFFKKTIKTTQEDNQNTKPQSKIISIISGGYIREDFIFYISKMLNASNKQVIVIDNSVSQSVMEIARGINDATDNVVQNDTMLFLSNIAYSNTFEENANFIIVYHGDNIDKTWIGKSSYTLLFTDFDKYYLDNLKKCLKEADIDLSKCEGFMPVFFNKFTRKINEKYILSSLNINLKDLESIEEYELNEKTEGLRICLQYDKKIKYNKIPQDTKGVLYGIYSFIMKGYGNSIPKRRLFKEIQ